eukprot:CCRYP_015274-RA/>CCRYP_015274-RA protein AED:0.29 eAED:0.29 QI:40/1/1/1/0/0.5/2/221/222
MDDDANYIELGVLNRSDADDKLTTAVFHIQRTILNHHPLYLQISKNEFAALLLKALGPTKISSSVVDVIFDEVDTDMDGWLSTEELAAHLIKMQKENNMSRYQFFLKRLAHPTIGGALLFTSSSALSILQSSFLRVGEGMLSAVVSNLIGWLSLIGSLMFVWGAFPSTTVLHQDTQPEAAWTKMGPVLVVLTSLDQVGNLLWVFGSLFYLFGHWLEGGLCFF